MSQFGPVCHISTLTYTWTLRHEGLNARACQRSLHTPWGLYIAVISPAVGAPGPRSGSVWAQLPKEGCSLSSGVAQGWTHPCTSRINSVHCGTEAPPLLLEGICSLSPVHWRKLYFYQCLKEACREFPSTESSRLTPPCTKGIVSRFKVSRPKSTNFSTSVFGCLSQKLPVYKLFWERLEWRQMGYSWTSSKSLGVSYRTLRF